MSVLRINQNPIALNANRNLRITGTAISKSLERLSSGLRINRAADDAAGLSISEKLRGQIRGLNRASSNAMDGISLIQTAEGALDEMHTILQRMRELAVQAANGIYTAGDRQALQLEVSQLTDEINRIARTTEFNTKRLLDGTMGALISTDDYSRIRAAVTGNVGAGGNFVLKAVAKTTGQLQVMKTDVFTTTLATDAVGQINYLMTFRADATITTAGVDGIGNTGLYQIEVPNAPGGSIAVNSSTTGRLRVSNAQVAGAGLSLGRVLQAEELNNADKILITLNTPGGVETYSIALSIGMNFTALNTEISNTITLISTAAFNPAGRISLAFSVAGVTVLNAKFVDVDGNGSDFYISFSTTGQSNFFFSNASVSFLNNGAVWSGSLARGAGNNGQFFSIGDPAAVSTGVAHMRFDTRYDWAAISTATATSEADIITWGKYTGGNSLQDYGKTWQIGPVPQNGTFLVSAITARTYAVFVFDNSKYTDLVAQGVDQSTALQQARGVQLSNASGALISSIGQAFAGALGNPLENIRLTFDGILQAGETSTFNTSTTNVLTADQLNTLASLNRFQEFGVFNGRKNVELELFLRGTAKRATVNFSTNDTLEDMTGKISLAIWNTQGTGVINSAILNPQQMPDLVHLNTVGVAKGTLSIVCPVPGAELVLSGDENVLKALSLMEVRGAQSPIYSVSAFNLELNKEAGQTRVDTNEINGLLPGLRIFFDNTLGLRLDPQPPADVNAGPNNMTTFAFPAAFERPTISLSGVVDTFFLHVAPRDFTLQTGANQGQQITGYIADHSAEALGVEGLLIVTSELAQEAITQIDVAINRVSNQRSRLGAVQNRLESTARNLDVAAENLSASESRIRDTDVAQETVISTRNQILLQAGVAALAQANQLPQTVLQLLR